MFKCINSPNFLWKIENFTSVQKKISPAVLVGGLEWQLTFTIFVEDGSEKIRLLLESLSVSETLSTFQFTISVYLVSWDGSRLTLKNSSCTLKNKELCIWCDFVSFIYKNFGQIKDITLLVTIYPTGKIPSFFDYQGKSEYFILYSTFT